jgi:tryptophanyl-tRNA synthetase
MDREMSKSFNGNIITIFFRAEKNVGKLIRTIKTDSTPMEAPKDPEGDNVFAIYSLLANTEQKEHCVINIWVGITDMVTQAGLYELIVQKFKKERESYGIIWQHGSSRGTA